MTTTPTLRASAPDSQAAMQRACTLRAEAMRALALSAATKVGSALRALARRLRRTVERRRTARQLVGLSDHLLADIGLTRADAQGLAWGLVSLEQITRQRPAAGAGDVVSLPRARAVAPRRSDALDAAA